MRKSFENSLPEGRLRPRAEQRAGIDSTRWLWLSLIATTALVVGGTLLREGNPHSRSAGSPTEWLSEDDLDQRLQQAATRALGERRGAVIVMDPQTGRVRAVVNPKLAFEESLRPGSTIKPFTTLAALRFGLLDNESRTLCREEYAHDDFHTVCAHPRGLLPLNPTEAIAYSCNYYFGKVGERLDERSFVSTLGEFGFGRKTGINAALESPGRLLQNRWQSQNAMGEGDNVQVTPIQIINAYSALVNGGHLFVPRIAAPNGFVPKLQNDLIVTDEQRALIVRGMRGAVRYGTAETAKLHALPNYIIGKTGTADQIEGFRTQGWFVGFASDLQENTTEQAESEANRLKLAVIIFLSKAHGSEAAQVARPIFAEYARFSEVAARRDSGVNESDHHVTHLPPHARSSQVRVHLVRENATRSMPLEDYVTGVVAAEGSTERESEALKALAIASRTFALRNIGRHTAEGYDFCSTTHCQRYSSVESSSSSAVVDAVEATESEVLRDTGNQIADSYFSASCGGATANITTLWGGSAPHHLRGVSDEYCATEAHHAWTDVITEANLLQALQSDPRTNVGARVIHVTVARRDSSGRAELVAIEGDRRLTVRGWDFKIIVGRALGWNLLKSSRFRITRSGSEFVFRGSGFGHGLGLCQEGAHVMAARGAGYRQILAKYFPETRIGRREDTLGTADLMWKGEPYNGRPTVLSLLPRSFRGTRRTLSSEDFRISYPESISEREAAWLLAFLQSTRKSLNWRMATASMAARLPFLEVFVNETTGDFVGRTGQPPWAAAATRGNRIEIQPLQTLRRRRILETTLRHELVHTLVDVLGQGRTPRWLAEGLAIHFAGEGRLVAPYGPGRRLMPEEIERRLDQARSAEEMKTAYAAAFSEVKRMIRSEGEASVWLRVQNSKW